MLKQLFRSIIQPIYIPHPSLDKVFLSRALKNAPIYIADVGSTGGPEKRWEGFLNYCHFYSFDPDPRALPTTRYSNHTFPIGLWSSKGTKVFYLCKNPSSSSCYRIDQALEVFLNAPCHEITKELPIEVDTIENILIDSPPVDFMKLDAEGADLEILKGARSFLQSSCLGVQVEIAWNPKHLNAPLFPEVDNFLRPLGYQLFDLRNERWIRKNNCFGLRSRPQIVWGNAVYFLSKEAFLSRLASLDTAQKQSHLSKFLLLLLIHRHHDYAIDIAEACKDLVEESFYAAWHQQIKANASFNSSFILRLLCAIGMGMAAIALFCPFPVLREKARSFVKARTRQFAEASLCLARHGPYLVSVSDETDL